MALAETSRLIASLELKDLFSGTVSKAERSLSALDSATGRGVASTGLLNRNFGLAGKAASGFGGALNHAKHSVGELLTGPLGVLGLAGGVGGVGLAIEHVISHTNDFAFSVEKLIDLTGGTAESMSTLLAVFEKFNISAERTGQIVGFAEKTLGNLAKTSAVAGKSAGSLAKDQEAVAKAHERLVVATLRLHDVESSGKASSAALAAARFRERDATVALKDAENKLAADRLQKGGTSVSKLTELDRQYGLHLVDTKGKLVDFDEELKQVADVYTSAIDPARKAALAAQLFGRGYADLVPILALGRAGINDAEQAAKDLGLTLTAQNAKDLKDYREALRETGDAIGGLELQIGLKLVPAIKDMAEEITAFLKNGGRDTIVGFFDKAVQAGRAFVGIIKNDVIPVLSGIKNAWDSIPQGFRDLIVTGLVANKTVKFLFGFSPITFAADALKGALGLGIKQGLIEAGLGKLFVQPVFVTNPGFGLPGAAGAAAGEGVVAGEAAAGAAGLGLGTIAVGVAAGTAVAALGIMGLGWLITATSSPAQLAQAAQNVIDDQRKKRSLGGIAGPAVAGPPTPSGDEFRTFATNFTAAANANAREDRAALHADLGALGGKITDDLGGLKDLQRGVWAEFSLDLKKLVAATKPADVQKAAKAIADRIAEKNQGSLASTLAAEKAIKDQLKNTHDPETVRILRAALAKVESKIPGRQYVERQITEAKKVAASSESAKQKLADLKVIEHNLLSHGDKHAATQIDNLIAIARNTLAMKNAIGGILNQGNNPGKNADDRSRPTGSGTTSAGGSKPTVADANAREDRTSLATIARFAAALEVAPKTPTTTASQGGLFVPTVKLDPSQVIDLRNGSGSGSSLHQITADFRAFTNANAREDRAALHADLGALGGKITDDLASFANREFALEARVLRSHESANKKIADLKEIERALKDHGLPHAAAVITAKIDAEKRALAYANQQTAAAIKDKDLSVRVNVPITVNSDISLNSYERKLSQHISLTGRPIAV